MTSHQVHGSYCFHQYLEEAHSLVSTSVTLAPCVTCHPYSVTSASLVRHHLFSPSCVPSLLVVDPHVYPHCLWWTLTCTLTACVGPSCVPSLLVVDRHVYPHCLCWSLTACGGPSLHLQLPHMHHASPLATHSASSQLASYSSLLALWGSEAVAEQLAEQEGSVARSCFIRAILGKVERLLDQVMSCTHTHTHTHTHTPSDCCPTSSPTAV